MDLNRLLKESPARGEEPDAAKLAPEVEAETDALSHPSSAHGAGLSSGASPLAPPSAFAGILDQLRGRPAGQSVVLRQLQRSYGNSFVGKTLRARMRVSRPDDAQEREAESLASSITVPPGPSGEGAHEHEESGPRSDSGARREGEPQGEGEPLAAETRRPLESKLNAELDDVRIHRGSDAGEMARALNARAFTVGRDIYFGEGEYSPRTGEGGRLLAHELAHVAQQKAGGAGDLIQRDTDDKQQEPDPATQVMGMMADPLWSLSGDAFKLLNGLEINHLLRTLATLRDAGQLTFLMQSLPLAAGVHATRLQVAMKAVFARKGAASAERFGLANRALLETLNLDQRLAVLRFIGPIPEQPLGEVLKIGERIYVVVDDEVRFGKEGDDTKTWRTNNPGALSVPPEEAVTPKEQELKKSIEDMMAKGKAYKDPADRFGFKWDEHEGGAKLAVFPTEEAGKAALALKLEGFQKQGSTLEGFGSSQLGSTALGKGYAQVIVDILKERNINVAVKTPMSDIRLEDLIAAVRQREGWNPHKKGVSVKWSDADAMAELPVSVQFRVMLAQWMRAGDAPAESK